MGKAIPAQHPAVVLRSNYRHLRALLAVAMIAIVGLTAAVVILATAAERDTGASSVAQRSAPGQAGSSRYDGGPEEGSRGVVPAQGLSTRYDGGPNEGTAALTARAAPATGEPNSINSPPGVRYDGGPEEGTLRALSTAPASDDVSGTRYDGGPEEGSRGSSH